MMEKEQKQCGPQLSLHQDVAPLASRVTFSIEKKEITAEQYRDWQLIAASLRKKINRERS
ncbi:hypothetical protein AB9E53_12670 [Escherichia coli]|uniref:hypothetical protein n=1 Tax=Escherichia coli TaxID=562 RepID=UPI000BE426CE|nr:hypothetical protein [Escherichia coli]EFE9644511.1 hypothetical protein [Escherichia coli]EFH3711117.1 hypothetical protein [Escherichia coli]EFM6377074.1 hypothetical protein [Escherichia coli]EFM6391093.1 hypothetical protein [Escherichia coli]EFM6405924.1 hypothetical protein [Escherichia coli]